MLEVFIFKLQAAAVVSAQISWEAALLYYKVDKFNLDLLETLL